MSEAGSLPQPSWRSGHHGGRSDGSLCSYQEPGDSGRWVPLPEEGLRGAGQEAASGPEGLRLQCRVSLGWAGHGGEARGGGGPGPSGARGPAVSPPPQAAGGRPVLYQVVAQHSYSAQGPADLGLQPGDTVDVLCEGRQQRPPSPSGPRAPGVHAWTWLTPDPCSGPGLAGGPLRRPHRHLPQELRGPRGPALRSRLLPPTRQLPCPPHPPTALPPRPPPCQLPYPLPPTGQLPCPLPPTRQLSCPPAPPRPSACKTSPEKSCGERVLINTVLPPPCDQFCGWGPVTRGSRLGLPCPPRESGPFGLHLVHIPRRRSHTAQRPGARMGASARVIRVRAHRRAPRGTAGRRLGGPAGRPGAVGAGPPRPQEAVLSAGARGAGPRPP